MKTKIKAFFFAEDHISFDFPLYYLYFSQPKFKFYTIHRRKSMKSLLSTVFIFIGFIATSQSYLVELDGDTVYCEIKAKGPSKIIATINNKKVKYSAKEIKSYYKGGTRIAAYVNMPGRYGAKGWTFLQPLEVGELTLYVVYTTRVMTDPQTKQQTTTTFTSFYAGKGTGEDIILLTVGWRKKLAELGVGCTAFIEKIETAKKEDYEERYLLELFKLYNNCPS